MVRTSKVRCDVGSVLNFSLICILSTVVLESPELLSVRRR